MYTLISSSSTHLPLGIIKPIKRSRALKNKFVQLILVLLAVDKTANTLHFKMEGVRMFCMRLSDKSNEQYSVDNKCMYALLQLLKHTYWD